jgi:glycopeptide antibiotics resistance protein
VNPSPEQTPAALFRLLGWCLFIVAVVAPWRSFQDHANWPRIRWVPFVSPPIRFRDIVGNVLLYVPVGYFVAGFAPSQHRWKAGIAAAALLSTATELTQLFSSTRFPSVQDFLLNVLGAAAGLALRPREERGTGQAGGLS